MRVEYEEKEARLLFFQELYTEAYEASETTRECLTRHVEQYKGSRAIDGSDVPAKQVRNITYELVESQVSGYVPNPVVTAKTYSEKNERCAKSIETLLRNKRDELSFEKMNDIDERFNPIYGGSVWLVEWDDSIRTHNTAGDVRVSCLSPTRFVGQPNIYEIEDMEYCFIRFETTKEDLVRRFGVSLEIAEETESDEGSDDKTATLIVCFYKNADDKVCEFIWSGETVLSDVDDYYARKRKTCRVCGEREELCRCEKPKKSNFILQSEEYEELTRDVVLSDGSVIPAVSEVIRDGQPVFETQSRQVIDENGGVVFDQVGGVMLPMMTEVQVPKTEPTRIRFYMPNRLPVVIRKNTSEEDSLLGQSDCEFIRPQQQAINKIESRIMEKLIKGGVFPIVPEDFDGELDNGVLESVFRAKQGNFALFGKVDLQADISSDIAESDRLYDQAKRILGITDSYQGQYDSSAQSGKAKQLQIQQAAGRLDSKRKMKHAAYAEIDKIIFQYYLAYADEPRPATFKDSNGMRQNVAFNRYDFVERDEAGEYYYNDEFLFSADATVDENRQRELLWQENRQNFQQGAYGPPEQPQSLLIFWLNMERAHYPWAHDNVERIRDEIARQNEIAQYQEQIRALQQDQQNRAQYTDYLLNTVKQLQGGQMNG